jgi:Tfp pilus assembly protein PilO
MILSKRERRIAVITVMAITVLVLDRGLLTPYLRHRTQLTAEKHNLAVKLENAHSLFARREKLSPKWKEILQSGLKPDAASAERTALNALRDWAEESGLTLSSLKPERSNKRGELQEVTLQVICTGPMSDVSKFLWQIEDAALPIKISDLQLSTRKEGTDDLTLQVRVAILCLAPPPAKSSKTGPKTVTLTTEEQIQ